jgi:SHS2 domain-containing protein
LSHWVLPTTADIGIRAFGRNKSDLLRELTLGMQGILLEGKQDINSLMRKTGRWEISHSGDIDLLVIKWLDEVIYRAEVYNEFLVDCQIIFHEDSIKSQVSFVDKNLVKLEVEIKAVTTHAFTFQKVGTGKIVKSEWKEIPEFTGPGWHADVIFDI